MDTARIVAIRKPKGPTSHDIVNTVRRITGERRVGHAGTLDPMAEGILVVGIGRGATKRLAAIVVHEKEYLATIRFGATSSTDDAEGVITENPNAQIQIQHREDIERVLPQYVGHILQTPPIYSALKVAGRPAHRRVRSGETVTLAPRAVHIYAIELLRYTWPNLELRVVCGPGVYMRALARDIGAALGVGGYLTALTRTRVGSFTRDTAYTLDAFARSWRSG